MLRKFLKSKIHLARLTDKRLDYEGSLTLDEELLKAAGISPFESIWIYNLENGERFETYVIKGRKGSREVCLNGAAARKGEIGDRLILVTYAWYSLEELSKAKVNIIKMDDKNKILKQEKIPLKGLF